MKCSYCWHTYNLIEQTITVHVEKSGMGETTEVDHKCPKCGEVLYVMVFDNQWVSERKCPKADVPEVRSEAG